MTFGPVQMLVVEFDTELLTGEILPELTRLREAGLVRLVDLLIVQKDDDGVVTAVETTDLDLGEIEALGAVAGALIGLGAAGEEGAELGAVVGAERAADGSVLDDEVWYVADAIPEGATAAVALIEHLWAIPLRTAIDNSGGVTLADEWIHPEDLIELGVVAAES